MSGDRIATGHAWRRSALLCALLALPNLAGAEKLPVTLYTTGNGLAHNSVSKILPDSRGFIWFATDEGLSRFDGYMFTSYGVADGLPSAVINDLLETRDGVYLIATTRGLSRLEMRMPPAGAAGSPSHTLFSAHAIPSAPNSSQVTALYEDRDGQVWVGTRAGLFALDNVAGEMTFRRIVLEKPEDEPPNVLSIHQDRFGSLWVGTAMGVYRLWPDGHRDVHFPAFTITALLEDRAGHFWLGSQLRGLLEVTFEGPSGRVASTAIYHTGNGLRDGWITCLFEPRDGQLWAGSVAGVIQVTRISTGHPEVQLLSEPQGLGRSEVQSIAVDGAGNFWVGLHDGGAIKVARSGFSTFGLADGLPWGTGLVQSRSGDLCFVGPIGPQDGWGLHCFDGTSFVPIRPALKNGTMSWGWKQIALQDHLGDWWLATRTGVARFAHAANVRDLIGRRPDVWYGKRQGLAAEVTLALFEDSRGDVWISVVGEGNPNGLSRWERGTRTFHNYSTDPALPDMTVNFPTVFAEDSAHNVWIGFSGTAGVARYRSGRFERFVDQKSARRMIRDLLVDSRGRLWIASDDGLARVEDPIASSPTFTRYGTNEGLSSNESTAAVEDVNGFLYIATARGLDRLQPSTGKIKHFTVTDGVPTARMGTALLDARTTHLWFTHRYGVSRLIPPASTPQGPPPVLITGVHVDDQSQPLQVLGEKIAPRLELQPYRNHLRIDYVALGFGPGEDLRYQYRLAGALSDWSVPSTQRTVNFASLAPGSYQFTVRAINADGVVSAEPATMAFTIVPPIWRRWWFLALVALAVASALYAVYRYRLARAVEIATMRTRIATDLHDDIGANLTKIAILSEVTRQQLEGNGDAGDRLSTIARISRESVASMSDVVWAINPKRDTLRDTIRRMRQHAEEVFAARRLDLEFHAPDVDQRIRVPTEVRRDFFLIFKEALNNAVRHSQCRRVRIDIRANDSTLFFSLTDDGVGFETIAESSGNGLTSMRRRAARIGGVLEMTSVAGHGTTVSLSVRRSAVSRLRHPA